MANSLYLDGEWVAGDDTLAPLEVRNPATGRVIGTVANSSSATTRDAIAAARRAFDTGPWPGMHQRERAAYLLRMAEGIEKRRREIVDLLVQEAGAVRTMVEPLHINPSLDHFIDMAERVASGWEPVTGMPPLTGGRFGQGAVVEEPIGVAALVTAFNFPFHLNLMKLGPALASGCTTVLKPSPLTPMVGLLMGEIAAEADLPPGVLNIVTGDVEAGVEMSTNEMVDLISFTGSGSVGQQVMVQGSRTLKKVVLELGGKSACIVFADADLDKVVPEIVMQMTLHSGQVCVAQTRALIERSIHDEVCHRVSEAMAAMPIGDPEDESTLIGPLISARQRERVEGFIETGVAEGATRTAGADVPVPDEGYFVAPTLFSGCTNDMTIAQEEIFGPVGVLIAFDDQEQAIRLANDTKFGLGAAVWSQDAHRAYEVGMRMRAGMVTLNGGSGGMSPYGPYGGYKQSGLGREAGRFGLNEYLEVKSMYWPAVT